MKKKTRSTVRPGQVYDLRANEDGPLCVLVLKYVRNRRDREGDMALCHVMTASGPDADEYMSSSPMHFYVSSLETYWRLVSDVPACDTEVGA